MIQTYTFGRCATLLDIDPKIFRSWVKDDLGLQETDQVSKSDRRVRYLTRDQLETLASQHEITLSEEDQTQGDAEDTPQSVYKLLADRVKNIEESLERYTSSLSSARDAVNELRDKTVEYDQLVVKQGQLEQRFVSLEEQIQSFAVRPGQNILEEQVQGREEQHIREIEQHYRQRIADLEAQLTAYQQKEKQLSVSSKSKAKRKKTQVKKLPASLASRSAFAQLHGVPDGTVASACSSGKIATVVGTWLYKSRTIHQALGERGKHDFYQVFHTRPDFKPCEVCPHENPA